MHGALDIRDTVTRREFTGFLKKFFRFSFAGGVVRVALPGRTFPTLSLSSPVERIRSTLLKNFACARSNRRVLLSLNEAIKRHSTDDTA